MSAVVIAALYKFTALPDAPALRDRLEQLCLAHGIKGTLLIAEEGINGTVAGSAQAIAALHDMLLADPRFEGLEYKESQHQDCPFLRLKVRLKQEIVTMGVAEVDPASRNGTYVDAATWNALLDDPDTLVIDTRNDYEVAIGQFGNAISPDTKHFRDFPEYVQRHLDPAKQPKIAMYCTGGIRCEKASHYLLKQGFSEVYHLKGGILQYLEDVAAEDNRWQGECFVFDERVSVDKDLNQGEHRLCRACRQPVSAQDRLNPHYEEGVSCPHCYAQQSEANRARARERIRQVRLAKARGEHHLGPREDHG
ncbi:rhodanese-related sulfurtransferase [Oceanococcus atlanticus]|uniref:tRNA uridine(34) hydroxylase n=1 Tax=Oceanococcus atlanticus TaxID=1317117 RepID=A0A1Y1SIB9_9GAMM|nr:rhodanese-related sulfurtransferase [Oceanococcus atlanticus]ORE89432.1 rhodanese-related sulfurtransferase [Oceanococcus atlanticus]